MKRESGFSLAMASQPFDFCQTPAILKISTKTNSEKRTLHGFCSEYNGQQKIRKKSRLFDNIYSVEGAINFIVSFSEEIALPSSCLILS